MTNERTQSFVYDDYTKHLHQMANQVRTTRELAKICQRMYIADYINLDGLDFNLAKEALDTVFDVLMKYPELRREMHYFGTLKGFSTEKDKLFKFLNPNADEQTREGIKSLTDQTAQETAHVFKNGGLALAYCSSCGDCRFCGIIIDEDDFDEARILNDLKYSEACGFSPKGCSSVKSVVDHELGHMLDYWLGISPSSEFTAFLSRLNPFDVAKNLSQYSVMNGKIAPAEVIAEGFSESRNSPSPRRLAREIAIIIDNAYKKKLKEYDIKDRIDNMRWE